MKKITIIKLLIILIVPLLFVGCGNVSSNNNDYSEEILTVSLGETGITFDLPSEHGFESKTSEKNDFYAQGDSGNWAVIVNHDEKDGYTLESYAQAVAKANNADEAKIASDGNYYFEYINGEYHFYTAVRQNNEYYYRVAFYCMTDSWTTYGNKFADWATTIKLDQNKEQ